jgi:hypothetical protein
MEPMSLPGVEKNQQPGPYCELVRAMQQSGREYPQFWHLFAFHPEATDHLARFTQEIMRGPAPINPGLRGLIAAYSMCAIQFLQPLGGCIGRSRSLRRCAPRKREAVGIAWVCQEIGRQCWQSPPVSRGQRMTDWCSFGGVDCA